MPTNEVRLGALPQLYYWRGAHKPLPPLLLPLKIQYGKTILFVMLQRPCTLHED